MEYNTKNEKLLGKMRNVVLKENIIKDSLDSQSI